LTTALASPSGNQNTTAARGLSLPVAKVHPVSFSITLSALAPLAMR